MATKLIHIDGLLGSDTNAGTLLAPVATIAKGHALSREHLAVFRGDFVQCVVAPGLYTDNHEWYWGEGVHADACQVSTRARDLFVAEGDPFTITAIDGDELHTKLFGAAVPAACGLRRFARITRGGVLVKAEVPFGRGGSDHALLRVDVRALVQVGDVVQAVTTTVQFAGTGSTGGGNISSAGKGALWNYDPGTVPGGANGWGAEGIEFLSTWFSQGTYGCFFDHCIFSGGDHNFQGGSFYAVNSIIADGASLLLYGGCKNGHDQAGSSPREIMLNSGVDDPAIELLFCGGGAFFLGFDGGDAAASGAQWVQERNLAFYDSNGQPFILRGNNTVFKMQRPEKVRGRLLALQGDGNASHVNVREGARFQCIPSRCTLDNLGANDINFDGATGGGKSWAEIDANPTHFVDASFGTMVTKHWS